MEYYVWLSFSKNGLNRGCCNVKASTKEAALEKCNDLGITPEYDDIEAFLMERPELPLDELVPKDFLDSGGWENYKAKNHPDSMG
jgi:hypothetical protein